MAIYTIPGAGYRGVGNSAEIRATISDPASDVTDVASTCADIIDALQAFRIIA